MKTSEQGRSKAKTDIRDIGYRIYRYDISSIRTGTWDEYNRRFEHFGIQETTGPISRGMPPTLEFMNAYNDVMDKSLQQKYTKEYMKYRHKILPPKGAEILYIWKSSNE